MVSLLLLSYDLILTFLASMYTSLLTNFSNYIPSPQKEILAPSEKITPSTEKQDIPQQNTPSPETLTNSLHPKTPPTKKQKKKRINKK